MIGIGVLEDITQGPLLLQPCVMASTFGMPNLSKLRIRVRGCRHCRQKHARMRRRTHPALKVSTKFDYSSSHRDASIASSYLKSPRLSGKPYSRVRAADLPGYKRELSLPLFSQLKPGLVIYLGVCWDWFPKERHPTSSRPCRAYRCNRVLGSVALYTISTPRTG